MKKIIIFLACILSLPNILPSSPESILIDDFQAGLSAGWEAKNFVGQTKYIPTVIDNKASLQATSEASASGLFYKIKYAAAERPILSWSWKIADIIPGGDARSKAGDDYAARIYVIFPSTFFWKTRSINYIWANKLPKGRAIASAYTGNNIMIALESGKDNVGKWMQEERNIYEDYKKYFGAKPPKVGAIALMTDTDNTSTKAMAWYGPITIKRKKGKRLKTDHPSPIPAPLMPSTFSHQP